MNKNINTLVAELSIEEKARLCSGADFWHTLGIERLGIPSLLVSDGPHGLRKQAGESDHLGLGKSIEAPCFPSAAGTAASFDRELLHELGKTLGEECRAQGVSILLGPGVNIKRSPLCGRNFEYFSEDPYLSGQLAASYIQGVQGEGIGTSIKHFAVNNQEERRMTVSVRLSERALHEIYLTAFEIAVREAQPWTVMSSYNRVDGTYTSESHQLLEKILREAWGFEGFVMTDWGACNERVDALRAGDELDMPGIDETNAKKIIAAIEDGSLDVAILDRAVSRILRIVQKASETACLGAYDRAAHHLKAREIARDTMVLLKNDGTLPLLQTQKIAFIGPYAKSPRYQGGGSSRIYTEYVVSAAEATKEMANVSCYEGIGEDGLTADNALLTKAVAGAKNADVAVVFVGLPDAYESEGYDRTHMEIPDAQNEMIDAVCKTGTPVVVVLHNGSPVRMPWMEKVSAILECYLAGEAVGEAQVDLLFGAFSPCAKLAETFPLRIEDTPCYGNFPGVKDFVDYGEGVYVGYRHYLTRNIPVAFPFGHGLTYTSFEYSDLSLSNTKLAQDEALTVTFKLHNTGVMTAKAIAQIYVAPHNATSRPVMELKQFVKAELAPREEKTVSLTLDARAFAWFVEEDGWQIEGGQYDVFIAASCEDLRLRATVEIAPATDQKWHVTSNTTLGDLLIHPKTRSILQMLMSQVIGGTENSQGITQEKLMKLLQNLPLRGLPMLSKELTASKLEQLINALNATLENNTNEHQK